MTIQTKPTNKKYRNGWGKVFSKRRGGGAPPIPDARVSDALLPPLDAESIPTNEVLNGHRLANAVCPKCGSVGLRDTAGEGWCQRSGGVYDEWDCR